ncbi:single-stranded DNA-binding protein [Enterococcus faecalis]|uniref:single-stranded DNA-binding protein n=1 Tax=Enterococcus gallinarum TaxID=1353 RepID=UPI001072F1AA|nr:single-stranded DNA-binding protein [Enterococcus gallinarum]MBF0820958.1 single-stranded DNA-binding protein [Enterococcus faecalis]MBF0724983.1 single-stranded DNA-binding protein [Enterococcus gallinarum]MBF0796251.1 single-stranded DNA-binding protein [Enterococcus gallinarum]MBX8979498.1 single-stranded DNA-binding protein [Enterococcus gallinarum]NYS81084.1 single-stranded DNA-binding protein [Enterococcus gallinarum]
MINNLTLVGRLTKDPDLKYTGNGTAVATFTLAVNRNFTNQSGEREADFINCVIWRKPAETLANYAKKGVLIGVTGRIQTRSYDNQQGQKVYVTEVIADNFQLLESKKADYSQNTQGSGVSNSQTNNYTRNQQNRNNVKSDPFSNSSIDIDDSLPF